MKLEFPKGYDSNTFHGLMQWRWPDKYEMPEWSYTDDELKLF